MSLKNRERDNATKNIQEIFINRRKFLAKFEYQPAQLYVKLMDLDHREALNYLLKRDMVSFVHSHEFEVLVADRDINQFNDLLYRIRIKVRLRDPAPKFRVKLDLGQPLHEQLHRWALSWKKATEEMNAVLGIINEIDRACKSPSEFVTLWSIMGRHLYPNVRRPAPRHKRLQFVSNSINSKPELVQRMDRAELLLAEAELLPKIEGEELAYCD